MWGFDFVVAGEPRRLEAIFPCGCWALFHPHHPTREARRVVLCEAHARERMEAYGRALRDREAACVAAHGAHDFHTYSRRCRHCGALAPETFKADHWLAKGFARP